MEKKVYSFKATGGGCLVSGCVLANSMSDATGQVLQEIAGYGPMNVHVSELRNQARALKEWHEKKD
jgi:hypothetical protein